jgi:hypothetical protein
VIAGGCSAPKLVYDRLDWLASWQVRRYASLDAEQQERFEADFAEIWAWHRDRELPRYATDLRALAQAVARPLTPTQVGEWSSRADTHWNQLVWKLAPRACAHLATFDDAQVASTLKRLDRNIAEDYDELVLTPEAVVRADRERRIVRMLERWLGDLDPAQRTRVERWNARRERTDAAWLDQRRLWRARFAKALAARRSPATCAELQRLFHRPGTGGKGELRTRFDVDRARWVVFLAELSATLSDRQREHLRAELLELGGELDALAAERSRAATSARLSRRGPGMFDYGGG